MRIVKVSHPIDNGAGSVNLDDLKVDPQFGHRVHPIAAAFPLMGGSEMSEFVADVQDNGLREPIEYIEHNGHKIIVDGRNRLRACRLTGRRPKFVECPVKGEARLLEYVWSKNLFRRHLTASQRAQVAASHQVLCDVIYRSNAKKRKATEGRPKKSAKKTGAQKTTSKKSHEALAEVAKVSPATMKRALAVQKSGNEKLIKEVKAGTKSVSKAAKEVRAKKAPTKSAKPKRSGQRKRADAASPDAIADGLIAKHSPSWCMRLAHAIEKKLKDSGDVMTLTVNL
jgi:ParB-like chromosome segregation protein Spo0J